MRASAIGALVVAALTAGCAEAPPERTLAETRDGREYQSADTQLLETDAFANPGYLWLDRGEALWREGGDQSPSCADCHGEPAALRGAATRYPQVNATGRLVNLTQRIEQCRVERQFAPPLPYESEPLLSLTLLVAHQSAGMAFDVSIAGAARVHFDRARDYYYTRRGQMNLACHHCHELNPGRMLRGDRLSQGQPTGYPTYRLQWQTLGSLHRRLRFCNEGIRAEPFDYGAAEYVALELFLAWRAAELPLTAPAVRR
ncbi:MAG: sulfur oxidation c-type cytochrome SoxA [Pseudomonadota bacterium]